MSEGQLALSPADIQVLAQSVARYTAEERAKILDGAERVYLLSPDFAGLPGSVQFAKGWRNEPPNSGYYRRGPYPPLPAGSARADTGLGTGFPRDWPRPEVRVALKKLPAAFFYNGSTWPVCGELFELLMQIDAEAFDSIEIDLFKEKKILVPGWRMVEVVRVIEAMSVEKSLRMGERFTENGFLEHSAIARSYLFNRDALGSAKFWREPRVGSALCAAGTLEIMNKKFPKTFDGSEEYAAIGYLV